MTVIVNYVPQFCLHRDEGDNNWTQAHDEQG